MKNVCGKWMPRAEARCGLLAGHKGNCRSHVWYCDGCGKPQSGYPTARDRDGAEFCFLCCRPVYRHYGVGLTTKESPE